MIFTAIESIIEQFWRLKGQFSDWTFGKSRYKHIWILYGLELVIEMVSMLLLACGFAIKKAKIFSCALKATWTWMSRFKHGCGFPVAYELLRDLLWNFWLQLTNFVFVMQEKEIAYSFIREKLRWKRGFEFKSNQNQ